ncbi:MAG: hypothetical protein HFG42_04215, partial [Lachnospiraceae bacterium]|nr:hypothetical protein [Lachnospiraceae bacterium]
RYLQYDGLPGSCDLSQTGAGKENETTQVQLSFNPQNIIQVNGTDSQEEMETKVRQSLSSMLDEMAADIARMVLRANGNIPGEIA